MKIQRTGIFVAVLFLIVAFFFCAQEKNNSAVRFKIDSLQKNLVNAKEDTFKVVLLTDLAWQLINVSDYHSAINYCDDALTLAKKLNYQKGISKSISHKGVALKRLGNYPEAIKYFLAALQISEKINDPKSTAAIYNNLGIIYQELGNYSEALKNHSASLEIKKEQGDKSGISSSLNNIGLVYFDQAVKKMNAGEDPDSLFNCASNFYEQSLKIKKQINDQRGIAMSYNNLGNILMERAHSMSRGSTHDSVLELALQNHFASLKIKEDLENVQGIISSNLNIGSAYTFLNRYDQANTFLQRALALALKTGEKSVIKNCYGGLMQMDTSRQNYKDAVAHYKLYVLYRDSLVNEENIKKTVREQMQFDFDKKSFNDSIKNTELIKLDEARHSSEVSKQKAYSYAGAGGFLVMIVITIISYKAFRNKKKATIEIESQKFLVELKQKEILDSIHYAKRIQTALLTSEKYIARRLKSLNKSGNENTTR
jgi:tetratricopeptide (TPR) repeat protein